MPLASLEKGLFYKNFQARSADIIIEPNGIFAGKSPKGVILSFLQLFHARTGDPVRHFYEKALSLENSMVYKLIDLSTFSCGE